jgi:hypothetical protein
MLLFASSVLAHAQTPNSTVALDFKPFFKETSGMVRYRFYRIGCGVTPVLIEHSPDAKFQNELRKKYQSQVVVISIVVDDLGRVSSARLRLAPDLKLGGPAMEAVKGYKFSPARLDGKPVWTEILAEIQISDGKLRKNFKQEF